LTLLGTRRENIGQLGRLRFSKAFFYFLAFDEAILIV
jgi:hypothetical protein